MKKIFILCCVFLSMAFISQDPYTEAMMEGKKKLQAAQIQQDFLAVSNQFARIAKQETERWLPSYYAGYAMIMVGAMESVPEKRDETLDEAQSFLDKISKLEHNECEVLALQGFIHMLRISVDPANRGQEYSGKSGAVLQKAMAMEPENGRVLHLLARLSYGTAQALGSSTGEACQLNEMAIQKFAEKGKTASIDNLDPEWGLEMAKDFRNQCK